MAKRRVLFVEDEQNLVRLVKDRLEFNNYEVIVAADGQEGLEKARKEKPDIIILDILLPKMDGYRVCRMLKFDENYKQIPIIMLTAKAQKSDEEMGLEVGADAYITKPFKAEVLLSKIEELLKR